MIIKKFQKEKMAKLNPNDVVTKIDGIPSIGITCFSLKLFERYVSSFDCELIGDMGGANGKHPIYKINYKGVDVALFMSRVGSSACVAELEDVFAMGIEKLIVFGTCGVLDRNIKDLAIIIPTSAIRDEGTSYHYLRASDEIKICDKYKKDFIKILDDRNCSYVEGKVWTTDAPYRETDKKIRYMKKRGAICVDMECSAISALTQFREKDLFQFFYAADNLDNIKWEERSLSNDARLEDKEKIIYLALELATRMK